MERASRDSQLGRDQLHERLESLVYRVLTVRRSVGTAAEALVKYRRADQERFLSSVEWIAETSVELAFNFAVFAPPSLEVLGEDQWESWVLHIMERYDDGGVLAAIGSMQKVEQYRDSMVSSQGIVVFEEIARILETFVTGLSGRALRVEVGDETYTDTETLYLPRQEGRFSEREQNYLLYKVTAVHLWSQTWYGTWRVSLEKAKANLEDSARAVQLFHGLETVRLDSCIDRDLPGVFRELQWLREATGVAFETEAWLSAAARLRAPDASVQDSYALLPHVYSLEIEPPPVCYQGELFPKRTEEIITRRLSRERRAFGVMLAEMREEKERLHRGRQEEPSGESMQQKSVTSTVARDPLTPSGLRVEVQIDGVSLPPRDDAKQLLSSIVQDFGKIPEDYLVPAGHGQYREDRADEPDIGSSGRPADRRTEGAEACFYDEWDYLRRRYRKHWCRLQEKVAHPRSDEFVARTLQKHRGVLIHLRRAFEALRGDDKRVKRQPEGDDVDLDSVVESYADVRHGLEGTERLFSRMRRVDRNIAVMFMVDMSGSTKGWINEIERESLVLLCESLEVLGDRYAIYGFSGFTHKRCEIFRIKGFDEPYSDEIRARISGILPQDYTRMGAAIRHLSKILLSTDSRAKLLITLSDGRPDDQDGYRGVYGIEDTRQALIEARYHGIHPYCITIDDEAMKYLPRLYGPAAFTVISKVEKLPFKVSEIYRITM